MGIPGAANPLLLASASGYQIERSLRFNSADSAHLSRTPASAGNRKTWTWAGWVKRSALNANNSDGHLFVCANGTTDSTYLRLWITNNRFYLGGYSNSFRGSTAYYRDLSAWYHFVCAVDTTQATGANRIKMYVNGAEITSFAESFDPAQNADLGVNQNTTHYIGLEASNTGFFNGYLAEIHFIDGQALTPTSFGETDGNGIWQPKAYTGTYGTNGFRLDFSDNSAATATTLGKDTSGNSNNWTPNNLIVASRSPVTYANTALDPVFNDNYTDSRTTVSGSPDTVTFASNSPVGKTFTCVGEGIPIDGTGAYQKRVEFLIGGTWTTPAWVFGGSTSTVTYANNTQVDGIRISITSSSTVTNYFTVDGAFISNVNTSAQRDSLVDTPTSYGTDTGVGGEVRGNYCTFNPLDSASAGLANGNLDYTSGVGKSRGTIAASGSGKYYIEFTVAPGQVSTSAMVGWYETSQSIATTDYNVAHKSVLYFSANGAVYVDGANTGTTTAASPGDIIGLAFDVSSRSIAIYQNNILLTTKTIGVAGSYAPYVRVLDINYGAVLNAGQRPFAYAAPSGFKALCTTNIPEGTITTSGTFTGNANADGPFVYLNGVPTAMTINGNAVTFATHADKLSNGFKVRSSSGSYNTSGSNTYSVTTTGAKFKVARAQPNP